MIGVGQATFDRRRDRRRIHRIEERGRLGDHLRQRRDGGADRRAPAGRRLGNRQAESFVDRRHHRQRRRLEQTNHPLVVDAAGELHRVVTPGVDCPLHPLLAHARRNFGHHGQPVTSAEIDRKSPPRVDQTTGVLPFVGARDGDDARPRARVRRWDEPCRHAGADRGDPRPVEAQLVDRRRRRELRDRQHGVERPRQRRPQPEPATHSLIVLVALGVPERDDVEHDPGDRKTGFGDDAWHRVERRR